MLEETRMESLQRLMVWQAPPKLHLLIIVCVCVCVCVCEKVCGVKEAVVHVVQQTDHHDPELSQACSDTTR